MYQALKNTFSQWECSPLKRIIVGVVIGMCVGLFAYAPVQKEVHRKLQTPPVEIYKYEIKNPIVLGERGIMNFHMSAVRQGCQPLYIIRQWLKHKKGKIRHLETLNMTGTSEIETNIRFKTHDMYYGTHSMRSVGIYLCEGNVVETPTEWRDVTIIPLQK